MKILKRDLDLKPIIIAEVGQNHQGDIKLAKKYAEGLTMSGEGIFTVNPKVEENSFDLDFNDEDDSED